MSWTAEHRDGTPVLVVVGEVDYLNADDLRGATDAQPAGPCHVDMAGVTYMDSSCLSALVHEAQQREVYILSPSVTVQSMLQRTGTASLFHVV